MLLVVWLGALFVNLNHISESKLVPLMTKLSAALHVPPRLSGVTLLGWANGAPDLSANIAAIRSGRVNLALGSGIGAGMVVVCLLGGLLTHMEGGMKVGGAMVRLLLSQLVEL